MKMSEKGGEAAASVQVKVLTHPLKSTNKHKFISIPTREGGWGSSMHKATERPTLLAPWNGRLKIHTDEEWRKFFRMRVLFTAPSEEQNLRLRKSCDLWRERRCQMHSFPASWTRLGSTCGVLQTSTIWNLHELSLHMFDKRGKASSLHFLAHIDCAARLSQQAETFFVALLLHRHKNSDPPKDVFLQRPWRKIKFSFCK